MDTQELARLGMQIANVKQRQILPRVGKIWSSTPQNRTYQGWDSNRNYPIYFLIFMRGDIASQ